jgi:hypothetical protein
MSGTNKKLHLANVIVFLAIIFGGGTLFFTEKKTGVSVMENRALAKFPTFTDSTFWKGKYFRDINLWYADNFPSRDNFISFSSTAHKQFGFQSSEIKMYTNTNDAEANEADTAKKQDVINDGPLPDDGVTGEKKKGVFVFKKMAFEIFGGGPAMGKSYADVINDYNRF